MTDIDEILSKLDKRTLEKFRMGREITKRVLPTASLGLNMTIGGGVGIGKQTTFFGNQSSGKSALMLQTIGLNQKNGVGCAYIDAEKTWDWEWAERLGLDIDHLPVAQVSSISDMADITNDWIKAGIELIVVDSTSALMPKSFYDDGNLKNFESTGQIGQFAKELGQACRMVQGTNFSAAFVNISQVRMDLGNSFMPGIKASGGKEVEHADSLRVKLFSSKSEKQALKGEVMRGGQLMEEIIGRTVTWNIDKNKVNGRFGTGTYDFITQGDNVGLDRVGELLDYGILFGVVEKRGMWIVIEGEKCQGRDNAVKFVKSNPEIVVKLEEELATKSI